MADPALIPDPVRVGNRWVFPNGKTIPVVAGGADGDPSPSPSGDPTPSPTGGTNPTPTPEPTPPAEPPAPEPGDEPLGEPGKRALESERQRAAALEKQLKTLNAELDQLRQASMSDQEKALADARSEGEKAAEERWRDRVGQAHVRAAAAGKFASPEDAHLFLDEIPFTDDGQVDDSALQAKLDALLESKPYLAAATPGATPAAPPAVPTGPRGGTGPVRTKDDLKRMSPDEIAEAYRRGELSHLTQST